MDKMQKVFNELGITYLNDLSQHIKNEETPKRGVRICLPNKDSWNVEYCDYDSKDKYPDTPANGGYPAYTAESDPSKTW